MEIDPVEILRKKGLKVTPQRLAVLKLLSKGGHYSGEQIFEELKKNEPSISLSTVYNALEALESAGIINSFEANGITWYEMRRNPHVNVICEDKNEIIDVDINIDEIVQQLKNKGINVINLSVVAYADCSKIENK
ncbi:Fur family transcriptional regulator [Acidianus hospitalis]|jgi:Fur family ferric uptake transcriptional regulator/Fur family peroxide stress response transcriptional regulator|uniref:Transcriptional repressor n=2 Tax=Acidianus hospitalis TaxID=563177 RepID=A0A2T9X8M2_9CREN|nr:Fur family transcriptional regulator [Acidianus hospitalis]AEE95170.1 ferric uptake regulator, Fur family [Acidianus hospitalis W1]MDT7902133.1 Fur family transcriptional regulator [Acidianus sp.]PVU76433.1 transcriptional repressor [Acidianus hospitalis]